MLDPGPRFASAILPLLLMATSLLFGRRRTLPRGYLLTLACMGFFAIGLTFTRAAWFGSLLAVVLLVLLGW